MIQIGEKIKELRLAKGISQDELAKYLDVDCKDVIKWEKGEEYPPLELIPVLADCFETTTDVLFRMESFDHEKRINEYVKKYQEMLGSGNAEGAVKTARDALVHFPSNFRIKYLLMYALYLACDRPATVKHYSSEIASIHRDIEDNCTDDSIRGEAKRVMALHLFEDVHDVAGAKAVALTLSPRSICREDMLAKVTEDGEKLAAIKENILAYSDRLARAIKEFIEGSEDMPAKEKVALFEHARDVRRMIFPRGDFYSCAIDHMYTLNELAILYMSTNEPQKALDSLEEAARVAADYDALGRVSVHTSPMVEGIKFNKAQAKPIRDGRTLRDIFMNEIICLQCFEPIRYDPRIKEICDIFL